MTTDDEVTDTPVASADLARQGARWTLLSTMTVRALRTLAFIIVARQLAVVDFGLVALASVFIAFLLIFVSSGFGQLIIQRKSINDEFLDTMFWFTLGAGSGLAILLAALSPVIANLLGQPRLSGVLVGLSPTLIFTGLISVPDALTVRSMQLKTNAIRHTIAAAVSSGLGICLAVAGAGVWALVAQTVTESAVAAAILWVAVDYRPRPRVNRRALAEMWGFGSRIVGSNIMVFISSRSDDLLIGTVLGPRALGLYTVGYRLLLQMQDIAVLTARQVTLPLFSRLQSDRNRLHALWRRVVRLEAFGASALFLAAAAMAGPITLLLFGPQWKHSIPVMAALAFCGPAVALMDVNVVMTTASGQPGRVLRISILNATGNLIAFAAAVHFGIVWVAIGYTLRSYLILPISYLAFRESFVTSPREAFRLMLAPATAAGIGAVAAYASIRATSDGPPLAQLAGGTAVFCLVGFAIARVIAPDVITDVRSLVDPRSSARARAK